MFFTITQLGYKLNIFHLCMIFLNLPQIRFLMILKEVFGNIIEHLLNNIISI